MKKKYWKKYRVYSLFLFFVAGALANSKETIISPLTGEEISVTNLLDRIYGVMFDNAQFSRPHDGLSKAQLVFEALVEGGITRYCAFYLHEFPQKLGPIRSIRHYFLDILCGYNALPIHYGFSHIALDQMQKENIKTISGTRNSFEIFERDPRRKPPFNAYTSMEKIIAQSRKLHIKQKEPVSFSDFNTHVMDNEANANNVTIQFSDESIIQYVYNKKKEKYERFILEQQKYKRRRMRHVFTPHFDQGYSEQIATKNIIILIAPTKPIPEDTCGRLDIHLHTTSKGLYISDGKVKPIVWSKEYRYAPFVFQDIYGKTLSFNTGNTWIEIIPEKGKYIIK